MNNFIKKILEYLALILVTGLMMFFLLKVSLGKFSDLTEINKSIKSVESATKSIKEDQSLIIIKIHELEETQNSLVKGIQKNNSLLKTNNAELVKLRKQYWALSKSSKQSSQPISRVSPKQKTTYSQTKYVSKPSIEFLDSIFYKRLKSDK